LCFFVAGSVGGISLCVLSMINSFSFPSRPALFASCCGYPFIKKWNRCGYFYP
jgi:hypothetical protein